MAAAQTFRRLFFHWLSPCSSGVCSGVCSGVPSSHPGSTHEYGSVDQQR